MEYIPRHRWQFWLGGQWAIVSEDGKSFSLLPIVNKGLTNTERSV